jgi:integrase
MQTRARVSPTFADVIRVLLLTGARKNEIAALTWDELDLERGVIRLRNLRAKNGDKMIVLSPAARAILEVRSRTSRFVFASDTATDKPIVGLQKPWSRVRRCRRMDAARV